MTTTPSATYSKATLTALDPSLRHRYDDAFFRNEVTNLRKQVDVLHDSLMTFMTRVEKYLNSQEEDQKRMSTRLARLEHHCKIGSGSGSKSAPAVANNLDGNFNANKRRKSETPTKIQSQLGNTQLPEGMIIHDEHGNQLGQIVTVDSTDVDVLGSVALLHVQESEEQAVEVQSETEEDVHLTGEYDEEYQETETEPEPEQEAEGADNRSADASGKVTPDRQRPRSFFRHATFPAPGVVDWNQLEGESRTMLNLPERKGKGGKVSGRLGHGSPAWTHLLRRAISRSIGEETMLRYAREGSRIFKMEQEEVFNEIKERVVNFCKKYSITAPDHKLMDDIAWAFLRNKKRYRAKTNQLNS